MNTKNTNSLFRKSLYSALIFFGTIMVLSVGYATWNNSIGKVNIGNPLSASGWNALVDNIEDLDSRWSRNGLAIGYTGGNVGIGTVSPNSPLSLSVTNYAGSPYGGAAIGVNVFGISSGYRTFFANGSSSSPSKVLNGNSLGSFGGGGYWTGKANPYFISGDVRAYVDMLATEDWNGPSSNGAAIAFGTTPNGGITAERMRIDNNGNVGIGTTNPVEKLHIKGYDGRDITFSPGSLSPSIKFAHNDNGNDNAPWASIKGLLSNGAPGYNYGHLIFSTAPNTTGSPAMVERMRIGGNGEIIMASLVGSYINGSAFVCADNGGRIYTSEVACP